MDNPNSNQSHSGWTSLGICALAIVVLIIIASFGPGLLNGVLSNWPLALFAIGIALLYLPGKSQNGEVAKLSRRNLAYSLMGLGVFMFLAQHHILRLNFWNLILLAVLIYAGLRYFKPELFRRKQQSEGSTGTAIEAYDGDAGLDDDSYRIHVVSILGGADHRTHAKNLSSGNVLCLLGGATIDIREADINGDTIAINVLAVMGGVEIRVPPHWQVSIEAVPFLGGVSNDTTCMADRLQMPRKTLVVSGIALMGGIDIRN